MKKVLKHPEIINPYYLQKNNFKDNAFIKDLGLDELLDFVEFCSSNAKEFSPFAKKVFVCGDVVDKLYKLTWLFVLFLPHRMLIFPIALLFQQMTHHNYLQVSRLLFF